MSKYELSLAKDYVPNWTVVDAVRELFQNALDQQTVDNSNTMFFNYENDILTIGNKSSVLSTKSLLLGSSTKANDLATIGQFGEGYKVAMLVLARLGKQVKIYNYGNREVWLPKLTKSRRYGAEILTFEVDKKASWERVPDNNLTIEITGVSKDEYDSIIESNLHLQHGYTALETPVGRALMDEQHKGKVYVNGLFVCNYQPYTHGYDFKPAYLKLDRDRKMASPFDLVWMSSKIWAHLQGYELQKLIKAGAADVAYLTSQEHEKPLSGAYEYAHTSFVKEYGDKAVPVTTQEELKAVPAGYTPVVVPQVHKEAITKSSEYVAPQKPAIKPLDVKLEDWLNKHKQSLSKKAILEMQEIIISILEE